MFGETITAASSRVKWLLGLYIAVAFVVVPVFPHFISPNEISRWLVAVALVESQTLEVTRHVPLVGSRMEDLSERDGRIYSNKAPGLALLTTPAYALTRPFFSSSEETIRAGLTAMRWAGATLPLLFAALVLLRLARERQVPVEPALAALLFATPLFAYGLLLFSHAAVAAALFAAWYLLFMARRRGRYFAAGALSGFVVVCEYPAAIPVAVLGGFLIATRQWRNVAAFIAAGAPFALLLATYNTICFGGPLELSSGHERLAEFSALAQHGVFGVGYPSPATLWKMLFGFEKGLFIFSPVLLIALSGVAEAKRRLEPRAFWSLCAVPLSIVLFYAGYPNWHGGWTVGPRYIVATVPFLTALLLFTRSRATPFLLGVSCVHVLVVSLVFPFVPNGFLFPWSTFAWPLLKSGAGVGTIFGMYDAVTALVVAFTIIVSVAVVTKRGSVGAGAAVAIALMLALTSVIKLPAARLIERAYVADVYLDRSGALEATVRPVPSRLEARRRYERTLPPQP